MMKKTETVDIVKKLRERSQRWLSAGWGNNDLFDAAADEIERLRRENQKKRERIMFLNSMIQTEDKSIRNPALKESE